MSLTLPSKPAYRQLESAAPGFRYIPTEANGTLITPGNGGYGSYAEIIAATAEAMYLTGAHWNWDGNTGSVGEVWFKLAKGAAGSEVVIAQWSRNQSVVGDIGIFVPFLAWIPVASGVRLAIAARGSTASPASWSGYVSAIPQASVEAF